MSETKVPKIYTVIPLVMAEVGAITKGRKNSQQNYSFRGIDDAYLAFQPLFAKHGMFVVPTVTNSVREERETKSGGVLIYTTLTVKHTFYADDGSSIDCVTVGEAMDSGDKSCNKSLSAAMKYALLEVFCVPTEEPKDSENDSPEPKARQTPASAPQPQGAPNTPPAPANPPQGQPASGNETSKVDWRSELITFGKNKGKTLGQLDENQLDWYVKNAEWKQNEQGVRKDTALGRALDAAEIELIDNQSR